MIAIIDYDAGNLKNVSTALNDIGLENIITREKKHLDNATAIILPGVGAFGNAVANLNKYGLVHTIDMNVRKGKPLLGICLGMQLLFGQSFEDGHYCGLAYIPGDIIKFSDPNIKIPHMGWNNLILNKEMPITQGLGNEDYVYYVHSYYAKPADFNDVVAYSDYSVKVPGIVQRDNVIGMQFHPEKSSQVGLQLLQNFKEILS